MSLYKQFSTDAKVEREGVVLQYGFNSKQNPIGIRVARAGGANAAYTKRLQSKLNPHRRQLQTETIDKKLLERLLLEVFCETVVLGWENVETENGEDLPFSYENALTLFTDLPELFTDVQEQATKLALFKSEVREVDSGN